MAARSNKILVEAQEADSAVPGMQALQRGLRVLAHVAEADGPLRFTALLEASQLPKGTLHRILQTLVDERYLSVDEAAQTYRLGSRPFQLAHKVWDAFDLRRAAAPELERLSKLAGEVCRLGVLDGSEVLYIDQQDQPRTVRLDNAVGARLAVHATALGKAMAAHLPEADRRAILSDADLTAYTDTTIAESGDLDQQLNIVKARGYAISLGEQHEDVNGVAAAILDHLARPLGAIGIVAPAYRMDADALHSLGREVIEAARRISGNIGELAMSIAVNPRPLNADRGPVSCVLPGADFLGEGPFWSVRDQRLYWVDILAPGLLSGDVTTGERSFRSMPELIGVAIPRAKGGFICATETGIKQIAADGEITTCAEPEADRPDNRFNDGKCDALGRLWVGSLAINTEPGRGQLWRYDPDGAVHLMEDGLQVSNGIGWSPDNRTMYFVDSGPGVIWAYDFDLEAGAISNRHEFLRVSKGEGNPDGLCVDAEGHIWVAMWDRWAVRCYAPDGALVRTITLPVPRPTSCCFGGAELDTLFITTARIRLSARHLSEAPMSGSVFATKPGVKGLPDNEFAG